MRNLLLALVAVLFAGSANAQQFYANSRVSKMSSYHTTVGTTTALAIPAASVGGNVLSWKVCNDAVNTSTYLLVGFAADAATDGAMIGPGVCYVCENCASSLLKALNVKAQAAANGYSVIQYRQ